MDCRDDIVRSTIAWLLAAVLVVAAGCSGDGGDGGPVDGRDADVTTADTDGSGDAGLDARVTSDGSRRVDAGRDADGVRDVGAGRDGSAADTDVGPETDSVAGASCDSPTVLTQSDVDDDVTLRAGCYRVDRMLIAVDTLVLRPGVTIEFAEDAGLVVRSLGELQSTGTADNPVVLTGTDQTRGHWRGLVLTGGRQTRLEHTVVEYGGRPGWVGDRQVEGCINLTGRVEFQNIQIRECAHTGLAATNVAFTLTNSTISNSATPLRLAPGAVEHLDGTNSYVDNDDNRIHVVGGRASGGANRRWIDPGVPLFIRTTIRLSALELSPGMRLEFNENTGLTVGQRGGLTASGTEDEPIVLTGAKAKRGYWRGIELDSPSPAVLEHVVLAHAGHPQGPEAGLSVTLPRELTVRESRFTSNQGAAIAIDVRFNNLSLEQTTFTDNETPLRVPAGSVAGIAGTNTFENNDNSHVLVDGGGVEMEASRWSSLSVPYRIRDDIFVRAPLTIAAGTTLEFERDIGIRITDAGALTIDASMGERITLTGVDQVQGYWRGIHFQKFDDDENLIDGVDILYAGSQSWSGGRLTGQAAVFVENGRLTINDTRLHQSGYYGLSVDRTAVVDGCRNLSFENNAGPAVYLDDRSTPAPRCAAFAPAEE